MRPEDYTRPLRQSDVLYMLQLFDNFRGDHRAVFAQLLAEWRKLYPVLLLALALNACTDPTAPRRSPLRPPRAFVPPAVPLVPRHPVQP